MDRNVNGLGLVALLVVAIVSTSAPAAPSDGPGGVSRAFHVDCGLFCPESSVDWRAEQDNATLIDGYDYSVEGRSYRGSGSRWHCWFFSTRGRITIRCPAGVEGTLYLYCLDLGGDARRQSITVCGRYRDSIERFPEPEGVWLEYPLTSDDTSDGRIPVELVRDDGANAIVSRVDFVPHGMQDVLAPESGPASMSPEAIVRWDWTRQERIAQRQPGSRRAVADVLERGESLRVDLVELGAKDAADKAADALAGFRRRYEELVQREQAGESVSAAWEDLYFASRRTVRQAAFANPRLDFDELLFVKRFTPSIGHQCSHHLGKSQRPGADLCILTGLRPDGTVRSVLKDQLAPGGISRPDLSYDARRIVFPYAAPRPEPTPYRTGRPGEEAGPCLEYQIHEISVDGSGLVRLTDGPHENTEPCYLPDGRICFTSSRNGNLVQCGDWAIVFSLHTMRADGSDIHPITEAKEGEWFPSVLDDGRIVYMRWEYIMKPFNTIQYLWTVHPDGTGAKLAYGDHFAFSPGPLAFIEARQIPGTGKLIATGAAHHNCGVGPIVTVDMRRNRGDPAGLTRLTPEVGYPETSEMAGSVCPNGWYDAPYPLSEKHYLVCYSFESRHNSPTGYGIYLADVHGNKELIYRDSERSCYSPIPLRARQKPPVIASRAENEPSSGTLFMLDVYQGLEGVPRGTVKYLRVLESVPKTVRSNPQRLDVGIGSGWDPRIILGTVDVEPDGSAQFEVPAGKPIFFEALDENYMDIRRMRSFVNLQPGERVGCIGCHESYASTASNQISIALAKPRQRIAPPPWGSGPMDFLRVVQPVLDRHCTDCHDGSESKESQKDPRKDSRKSFDLRAEHLVPAVGADNHIPPYPDPNHSVVASFANLLEYVDFTQLSGYEGGNLPLKPYGIGSHKSRLVELLDADHHGVRLTTAERRAIVAWIDCNAPYLGGWDEYLVEK